MIGGRRWLANQDAAIKSAVSKISAAMTAPPMTTQISAVMRPGVPEVSATFGAGDLEMAVIIFFGANTLR